MKNTTKTNTKKSNTTATVNTETTTTITTNTAKVNRDFTDLYTILTTCIANKNQLALDCINHGYLCTQKTKNQTDYTTTTPNDFYIQLVDGTRLFLTANRKKVGIYTNASLLDTDLFNDLVDVNLFVPSTDSAYRNCMINRVIPFTVEWLQSFMTRYCTMFDTELLPTK